MSENATFYDNLNNAESVNMSNGMTLQDAYNVVANRGLKATKIEINNPEISTLNPEKPEEMSTEITFGSIKSPDSLSILRKHRITNDELVKLLEVGMEHEMEHTTDMSVAMAIAKAHIYENKDYYKKLQELKLARGAMLQHKNEYKRGGSIESPKINWSEYYKKGGKVSMPPVDKNGVRKIDADSIERLTEYVNSLPQTKYYYFDTDTNDYRKDRKKLHASIINEFKKDVVCITKGKPIAIMMGGSPASGKSSFLKKYSPYLLKSEILKVDADEIRAKLPEYEGWNASQTHLETKDIVNTLISDRNIGIPCDFDLIYDGTMNNVKSYKPLIKLLKERGYKIFIVYMDNVPKEVIEDRILKRYQKSGRFVPLEVVDDFFSKGKSAFNELKDEVDGYMIIDGSSTDYNIIDQGGMKLPQTRSYSKLGQKITESALPEEYAEGGEVNIVKKDRYGNDVKVGDAIHIRVLVGKYGETKDYEGIVTGFDKYGNVELDGQRKVSYNADYKHNDYEHGHHIWVEKINKNDIKENLRVPKKYVPYYSGTINGENFKIVGKEKFKEWLDDNYPNSVFSSWYDLHGKGWRYDNNQYLSPEKIPYSNVPVYESAEKGQGFLYSLMIPINNNSKPDNQVKSGQKSSLEEKYKNITFKF